MRNQTRHYFQRLLVPLLVAGATVFVGCDSGGDHDGSNGDGGGIGTYTVRITGEDVDDSLSGSAFFSGFDVPEEGFAVLLANETDVRSPMAWLVTKGSQPSPGDYQVMDGFVTSRVTGKFVAMEHRDNLYFVSTEGTMTITNSSAARVSGSFELEAVAFLEPSDDYDMEVRIAGTFDAIFSPDIPFW